jgi:hypothetical protein
LGLISKLSVIQRLTGNLELECTGLGRFKHHTLLPDAQRKGGVKLLRHMEGVSAESAVPSLIPP